jgi:hypothetical protein
MRTAYGPSLRALALQAATFLLLAAPGLLRPPAAHAQGTPDVQALEAQVARLFERSCTTSGCHTGPVPQMGMDLNPGQFFASVVNKPSQEVPALMRVHPGRPDSSYLIMKVRGAPGIVGAQMPFTGEKLTEAEIKTIEDWITGLAGVDVAARAQQAAPAPAYPFAGWKAINLPTTRTVSAGSWLFLIGHRFNPRINTGYNTFFGLDGSGIILLTLGYALTDDLLVSLGRSNAADNVEIQARYRLADQTPRWPVTVAAQGTVNWITEERPPSTFEPDGQDLKFAGQVSLTRALTDGLGVAVVPGVLLNAAEEVEAEPVLVTVGLAARWRFTRSMAVVAEWVPIVSGYTRTTTFGNDIRFDTWGTGLEIATGGHVFQIVLSNSVGLATDQYLRGGDLDIRDRHVRLGFNIFRILNF